MTELRYGQVWRYNDTKTDWWAIMLIAPDDSEKTWWALDIAGSGDEYVGHIEDEWDVTESDDWVLLDE